VSECISAIKRNDSFLGSLAIWMAGKMAPNILPRCGVPVLWMPVSILDMGVGLSVIGCLVSGVGFRLSGVGCRLSGFGCQVWVFEQISDKVTFFSVQAQFILLNLKLRENTQGILFYTLQDLVLCSAYSSYLGDVTIFNCEHSKSFVVSLFF
jgi:hypothetical protein